MNLDGDSMDDGETPPLNETDGRYACLRLMVSVLDNIARQCSFKLIGIQIIVSNPCLTDNECR